MGLSENFNEAHRIFEAEISRELEAAGGLEAMDDRERSRFVDHHLRNLVVQIRLEFHRVIDFKGLYRDLRERFKDLKPHEILEIIRDSERFRLLLAEVLFMPDLSD